MQQKESESVHVQEQNPVDIRLIALADPLTILCTGLLTDSKTDYAQRHDIPRTRRVVEKRAKGTARQLLAGCVFNLK